MLDNECLNEIYFYWWSKDSQENRKFPSYTDSVIYKKRPLVVNLYPRILSFPKGVTIVNIDETSSVTQNYCLGIN
jgi:hypothetical protein